MTRILVDANMDKEPDLEAGVESNRCSTDQPPPRYSFSASADIVDSKENQSTSTLGDNDTESTNATPNATDDIREIVESAAPALDDSATVMLNGATPRVRISALTRLFHI